MRFFVPLLAFYTHLAFASEEKIDYEPFPDGQHSYANIDDFRVRSMHLDWTINFRAQRITGIAELEVQRFSKEARYLDLDVSRMSIFKIEVARATLDESAYSLSRGEHPIGASQRLRIDLKNLKRKNFAVKITYSTGRFDGKTLVQPPQLFWLPEKGKAAPSLLSVGETVGSHGWFPCQNVPEVLFTYSANVKVIDVDGSLNPERLRPLMSSFTMDKAPEGYMFAQFTRELPAYLIVINVGDFRERVFEVEGEDVYLYGTPDIIDHAAKELGPNLPNMIRSVEKVIGEIDFRPIRFLMSPKSFMFGGMENPYLILLSPTILTRTKNGSLAYVPLHELCHSFCGFRKLPRSWGQDFAAVEGTTTWAEWSSMREYFVQHPEFVKQFLRFKLEKLRETLKQGDQSLKSIVRELGDRDPDEWIDDISFEKFGFFFLTMEFFIDGKHGEGTFRKFAQQFKNSKGITFTFEEWIDQIESQFFATDDAKELVDWNEWMHGVELPKSMEIFEKIKLCDAEFDAIKISAEAYVQDGSPLPPEAFANHICLQYYLHTIRRNLTSPLTAEQLKPLWDLYKGLEDMTNAETDETFMLLVSKVDFDLSQTDFGKEILEYGQYFLTSTGRSYRVKQPFVDWAGNAHLKETARRSLDLGHEQGMYMEPLYLALKKLFAPVAQE